MILWGQVSFVKFMCPDELYWEPEVWQGMNMHEFYKIPENSKAIYVRGNIFASNLDEIALTAKTVEINKVKEAAKGCANWRKQKNLSCEVVEEVVLSILGGKPWKINEYYNFTDKGMGLATVDIVKAFLRKR